MPASWHVTRKSLMKLLPLAPKNIGAHMLNFKPIFERSLLKIVGGSPLPIGCALGSLGHSLVHVKYKYSLSPFSDHSPLTRPLDNSRWYTRHARARPLFFGWTDIVVAMIVLPLLCCKYFVWLCIIRFLLTNDRVGFIRPSHLASWTTTNEHWRLWRL